MGSYARDAQEAKTKEAAGVKDGFQAMHVSSTQGSKGRERLTWDIFFVHRCFCRRCKLQRFSNQTSVRTLSSGSNDRQSTTLTAEAAKPGASACQLELPVAAREDCCSRNVGGTGGEGG